MTECPYCKAGNLPPYGLAPELVLTWESLTCPFHGRLLLADSDEGRSSGVEWPQPPPPDTPPPE